MAELKPTNVVAPSASDPLRWFSPSTRAWFRDSFEAPTSAQVQGWTEIAAGNNTLILAPTGSGKTLAAFLWALDRVASQPQPEEAKRCRILYVSPLKALSYDVERNLRAPLAGIARSAEMLQEAVSEVRVGTRTGDTPSKERRDLVKHPPDILITTPESLYLMLTSGAREILTSVEHVIIDEIHAVAGTKRGAHLALSLERLDAIVRESQRVRGAELCAVQRVGLSATQRPLEELARFLGGRERNASTGDWHSRPVSIVDTGIRKTLEIQIVVPVEDMGQLGKPITSDDGEIVMRGAAAGSPEARHSIWPSIYPKLLELIRAHRSTLVFVNSRRLAERLAGQLNELAAEEDAALGRETKGELVRAHHGSVAREQRLEIEELLKAGKLPALVATSSLELGIDMGAIDLVVQVEAPTSVASGLQRIGRAGHQVGQPSKGFVFPKYRGDLVVASVVTQRMHAGLVEETHIPRNPLDVLAQQIVAVVAGADMGIGVDEVRDMMMGAYNFAELSPAVFEGTLDMLAGRYPSDEFTELRPRLNWDRITNTLTPRAGSRLLAVTSGGTIPDRGLFGVFTPGGGRVGELDEEMVYESRVGETFVLGATTWRIEDITRDKVTVTPAPGEPGKMPFWHGDKIGRPYELGQAVGAFLGDVDNWSDERLHDDADLDPLAVQNLRSYISEEREATGGVLPTDKQIVVERFRDELGDWRVCILSPFGARVHAPWALAIEAKVRNRLDLEVQAIWGDDGIVVRLPESDEALAVDSVLLEPEELEELVVNEVGKSALFAARFRENAARALLLPRRRPGSRTPLWQQRQRAADLLAVAHRYADFPIILETYRECLRDVYDIPALINLMTDIRNRRVRVTQVDLQSPSPFASSLAFAYVAGFLYEGDAPLAERRAAALTLDRGLLAELLGADELRELIDASSLESLEAELQALSENRQITSVDHAHDLLVRIGDLRVDELRARCDHDYTDELITLRYALQVRVAGEERLIAVEDAGRYRDALGVQVPMGVPMAFLEIVPNALTQVLRRWVRTHGPFLSHEPAQRFGLPVHVVDSLLEQLVADGRLVRGAFRPQGHEREWCDSEVLRLLKQRSLAALRREVEPAQADALVRFLPAWHGVGSKSRGIDRLAEVLMQLEGTQIPASVFEADVLGVRMAQYSPKLLDELLAGGELIWVGAGSVGRRDGRIVMCSREHASAILSILGWNADGSSPFASDESRPSGDEHERLRELLATRGACFFRELASKNDGSTVEALWDLVWSGEVTNDSFAALRSYLGGIKGTGTSVLRRRESMTKVRLGALSSSGPPTAQGRWSLVCRELQSLGELSRTEAASIVSSTLLERHGILTREAVRGEGVPGGFSAVYPVLKMMEESGKIRRGYFIAELGGAQFALAGAVDRIRAFRTATPDGFPRAQILAATDPANPFGISVSWPIVEGSRFARLGGAYVVIVDGVLSLYVERGAKGLIVAREADGTWEQDALNALLWLLETKRMKHLSIERVPDAMREVLLKNGFIPTPKGLVKYA